MRSLHLIATVLCLLLLAPAVQAQPAESLSEDEIYEKFRAWGTQQPPVPRSERRQALDRYREVLADEGLTESEVERHLGVIVERGRQLEVERWDRILTSPKPRFNTEPNAFLAATVEDMTPGRALDVGMGQGRNAIYLAQLGWEVTGFDPAAKAVAAAEEEARRLGLTLDTHVQRDDQFDFGTDEWDLIVLSYVSLRQLPATLLQALKPGGLVVVEAFHRDATKTASIGGGVVFDTNELLRLFDQFRILHYEDVEGVGDFGKSQTRIVRLCVQKQ